MPENPSPRKMTAIAAMAKNRVIGAGNAIPWHVPEDFKFFKATTMGGILLMGRKTYESIGRPLPGRITAILSRTLARESVPVGVVVLRNFSELSSVAPTRPVFLAGGAMLYRQLLPACMELILTEIDAEPAGDAFFPPFEHLFSAGTLVHTGTNFVVKKYTRV